MHRAGRANGQNDASSDACQEREAWRVLKGRDRSIGVVGGGAWKGVGEAAKERRHSCCGYVVFRAERYVEPRGGESLLAVDGKRRLSRGRSGV